MLGRSIIALITMGLLLPLMACGRSGERSAKPDEGADRPETTERAAPAKDLADLTGTEWVLVSLEGRDPVEGSAITLEFPNRGELAGEAGCDHYFSLYEIGGHNLHFTGRGLEVTDVECGKTEITLAFDRGTLRESGTLSGSAGCNTYTADYTYHHDSLTLEALAVTEMACEDTAGVMEQEQRYLSFLEGVGGYYQKIDGRLHLVVTDECELVFGP